MREDKLFKHILDDNTALFKQAMALVDRYHEALDVLKEYHDELELAVQKDSTLLDPERCHELVEKYEKVMKEGKKG